MGIADPKLIMLCGKIASGKSTLAQRLSEEMGAIVISEDAWLGALFADQMTSGADYLNCAAKLRAAMAPHIANLLRAGLSVVLDFPANTRDQRGWMRDILTSTKTGHELHLLDTPDDVCLARLRARNDSGAHPFTVSEEQFHRFSRHYDPPHPDEGFAIIRHRP